MERKARNEKIWKMNNNYIMILIIYKLTFIENSNVYATANHSK